MTTNGVPPADGCSDGAASVDRPPPDDDVVWFVPTTSTERETTTDGQVDGDDSDGDESAADLESTSLGGDQPGPVDLAPGIGLAWSDRAEAAGLPAALTTAARLLWELGSEELPRLSHTNPGDGQSFGHDELAAVLDRSTHLLRDGAGADPGDGDALARWLVAAHDGGVVAGMVATHSDDPAVAAAAMWLTRAAEEAHNAMWRRFRPLGSGRFRVRLRRGERTLIRAAVEEQRRRFDDGDDAALAPLFPPGYGDDEERSAEYRDLTYDSLRSDRIDALERLQETLSERVVDAETLSSWMRTVNDIRLVLGSELEVTDDEPTMLPQPWDPQFVTWRVYALLGAVVHEAVMALRSELPD